jgi:hypothetical protein
MASGAWVSGPRTVCSKCGGTAFRFVSEWFDAIDRLWVGSVDCTACGANLSYTRRPEQALVGCATAPPVQQVLPLDGRS